MFGVIGDLIGAATKAIAKPVQETLYAFSPKGTAEELTSGLETVSGDIKETMKDISSQIGAGLGKLGSGLGQFGGAGFSALGMGGGGQPIILGGLGGGDTTGLSTAGILSAITGSGMIPLIVIAIIIIVALFLLTR